MKFLVVVPTRREGQALRRPHFVSGAGPAGVEMLGARIAGERPAAVLIAGYCGGLDPSLRPGSVILARDVVAPGCAPLTPDQARSDAVRKAWRAAGLPFVRSRLLTVTRPADSRTEKRDLWNEHGAAGIDMETYDLARAAEAAGVPWLAIRVVLDPAAMSLPGSLRSWDGATRDRQVVRSAAIRPWEWPGMVRLGLAADKAGTALRRAVRSAARAPESNIVEELELVTR